MSAFAPLRAPRVASLKMSSFDISDAPGITAPFGYFDPAGFSATKSAGELKKWREAELKHGRVAMLAALGILTGEAVEFSTPLFGDKIVGPAIFQFQEADQITGFGFAAFIVGLVGAIEAYGISKTWETPAETADRDSTFRAVAEMKDDFINGDLGFDPLGLKPKTPEAFKTIQTKEINNGTVQSPQTFFLWRRANPSLPSLPPPPFPPKGRLAMIGTAGMIVQELVNGKGQYYIPSSRPSTSSLATFLPSPPLSHFRYSRESRS